MIGGPELLPESRFYQGIGWTRTLSRLLSVAFCRHFVAKDLCILVHFDAFQRKITLFK
jgi:hypothetical protein